MSCNEYIVYNWYFFRVMNGIQALRRGDSSQNNQEKRKTEKLKLSGAKNKIKYLRHNIQVLSSHIPCFMN